MQLYHRLLQAKVMNECKLYVFNPDHDLALANGDENFIPPRQASTFAGDAAALPIWYASDNGIVLDSRPNMPWFTDMQKLFPQLSSISIDNCPDLSQITSMEPWGWDRVVYKRMKASKITNKDSVTEQIAKITNLSHRRTAIAAMNFLREDHHLAEKIPTPAVELRLSEIEDFKRQHEHVVFKAPWSGSGQGLFWIKGCISENAGGWIRNTIEKQGSIIGEKVYDRRIDFAMEFSSSNQHINFEGYSLFKTGNQGIYRSNTLLDNTAIEKTIGKYISADLLLEIRLRLMSFAEKEIAPFYNGYFGIDMFIYSYEGEFMIHPCVEINLRMTMGLVARKFFDNFMASEQTGIFNIDYFAEHKQLIDNHNQKMETMPLHIENGRITSGYMSLLPITETSHYQISVNVFGR